MYIRSFSNPIGVSLAEVMGVFAHDFTGKRFILVILGRGRVRWPNILLQRRYNKKLETVITMIVAIIAIKIWSELLLAMLGVCGTLNVDHVAADIGAKRRLRRGWRAA